MLEHGGRLRKAAIQYGIAEADWLDLSSGLAPWPWPIPEIPLRAWARLPETDDGLERAASEYYGAAHVLPVPGSQAAIQLLPRLRRAGKVGVLSPCYAEHAEAWRRAGYVVREVLEQEVDFFLDGLDVLVVVNPNNPTGLSLTPERLDRALTPKLDAALHLHELTRARPLRAVSATTSRWRTAVASCRSTSASKCSRARTTAGAAAPVRLSSRRLSSPCRRGRTRTL